MARIGPNQDINDPETIINLAYVYQQMSNDKGDFLAQSNAQNPNVEGPPIVNVSIPFRIRDGSTELLFGSNIFLDNGEYIYDTDLVASASIVTYVDLAERFRDYWSVLNNVLGQLADFEYSQDEEIPPAGPFETTFPGGGVFAHGTLGGTSYDLTSYSHSPSGPVETPEWDGFGPASYNQLTYPQLLSALSLAGTTRNEVNIAWDEDYSYSKETDAFGGSRRADAYLGKTQNFGSPNEEQYVQFHNPGSTDMAISLSMSVSASFNTRFSAGVSSWAEIGNLNVYPTPFGGIKAFLPSYEALGDEKLAPGGVLNFSDSRVVVIPPGKSAFVGGSAAASTGFGGSGLIASVSCSVTVNGRTVTNSADLSG